MKTIALAVLLAGPAAPALAQTKAPAFKAPPPTGVERVLRVKVDVEYAGMTHSADFLVEDANQANFVQGGEKPFPAGKGVEFKKWGFIVNTLAAENPDDHGKVGVQLQLEVSGPAAVKDAVEMKTWQLQTTVTVTKGKPKTLSRGAGKAVVTVTDDSGSD